MCEGQKGVNSTKDLGSPTGKDPLTQGSPSSERRVVAHWLPGNYLKKRREQGVADWLRARLLSMYGLTDLPMEDDCFL